MSEIPGQNASEVPQNPVIQETVQDLIEKINADSKIDGADKEAFQTLIERFNQDRE